MQQSCIFLLFATITLNLFCQQDSIIVLDSSYSYYWYSQAGDWVLDGRNIYTYNADGIQTGKITADWDFRTNGWVNRSRQLTIYDASGNIIESVEYLGYPAAEWYRTWRYVNTYDSNGKIIEINYYDWDSLSNDWADKRRYTYKYDTQENLIEDIRYLWNPETNGWVFSEKTVSFWSTLKRSMIDLDYTVYPNPFTDYFTIILPDASQVERIDLIDAYGRIVRIIDDIDGHVVTIQRGNLIGGIYYIRFHSNGTYTKKLITR